MRTTCKQKHCDTFDGERLFDALMTNFQKEGLPLKYDSDDYSDDLPHWVPMPGGGKDEGLLVIPCQFPVRWVKRLLTLA